MTINTNSTVVHISSPVSAAACDVTGSMLLARLALLHAVACLDVQVEGELAFELRVPGVRSGRQGWFRVDWARSAAGRQELRLKMQARQNVTAAPDGECIYQYPEKEQVDALLSNMMNELTKASSLVILCLTLITSVVLHNAVTLNTTVYSYILHGPFTCVCATCVFSCNSGQCTCLFISSDVVTSNFFVASTQGLDLKIVIQSRVVVYNN